MYEVTEITQARKIAELYADYLRKVRLADQIKDGAVLSMGGFCMAGLSKGEIDSLRTILVASRISEQQTAQKAVVKAIREIKLTPNSEETI